MKFLLLIISASLIGLGAWAQAAVEETTCASADFAGRAVVGLEGYAHFDPALHAHRWAESYYYRTLFDQGCEAAIFKATVCSITGRWPDGDQCSVAYEGCSNEHWVSALDHDPIIAMVEQMKANYAATGRCIGGISSSVVVEPAPVVQEPKQEPVEQPKVEQPKVEQPKQVPQQPVPQPKAPQQQQLPQQQPDQG